MTKDTVCGVHLTTFLEIVLILSDDSPLLTCCCRLILAECFLQKPQRPLQDALKQTHGFNYSLSRCWVVAKYAVGKLKNDDSKQKPAPSESSVLVVAVK